MRGGGLAPVFLLTTLREPWQEIRFSVLVRHEHGGRGAENGRVVTN